MCHVIDKESNGYAADDTRERVGVGGGYGGDLYMVIGLVLLGVIVTVTTFVWCCCRS